MRRVLGILGSAGAAALLLPSAASAHEVYVLTPQEIESGMATRPFDMLQAASAHLGEFFFWAFLATFVVFVVFGVSVIRPLERLIDPIVGRGRRFAPAVARITIGLSFIAGAYYQATYGPELSLGATFGDWSPFVTLVLVVIGILITLGVFARAAALVALLIFGIVTWRHGFYMLTYTNYLGEIIVLLLIGGHHGSIEGAIDWAKAPRHFLNTISRALAPYSLLILRVAFGISLLYASVYAKILHNQLALEVASLPLSGHPHSLSYSFGLEPHFLVLGAAIIEIVIALFFIFGVEIRFTSLFLEFWLALSLVYFGEVVWPHVILIGIPIAFFLYGYDKYSVEGYFFKKGVLEPVL